MLLAGALSDAYLAIADTSAGVGHGRFAFIEYDPQTGQTVPAAPRASNDERNWSGASGEAVEEPTWQTSYIHADHLGSTRLVTDEMGLEISRFKYYPFGHYAETSGGSDVRMKFTGHERDESLGLDYMLARYYSTGLGRFLTADPGDDTEPHDPQSWSLYGYVRNRPTVASDPNGTNLWTNVFRVARYLKKEGTLRLVARIEKNSKNKVMRGMTKALDDIDTGQGARRVVISETAEARDAAARQLSDSGKIRGPEKSGIYPEHVNPADGPYHDVHVQTVEDTKKAGFGEGLLGIVAPMSMAAAADSDATTSEIVSTALWDVAKAIDPLFLTDLIEMVTGADEYSGMVRLPEAEEVEP